MSDSTSEIIKEIVTNPSIDNETKTLAIFAVVPNAQIGFNSDGKSLENHALFS